MKFKKLFASVLAIALAVAAIPAAPAKADVIEGQTAFKNTEVYKTVLPTTDSQKFYLDPQGLSQVGQTGQAALPTGNAGQVVGKTTMSAINLSSRAVKMDVKYVLDVASADMDVVALADSGTSIKTAADTVTKPAICLTVTAKNTNAAKAVTAAAATLAVGGTDSVAAVASGTSFTAHAYEFEAADYQAVTKSAFDATDLDELYNSDNYDYIMNTTGASIELEIGGICLAQGDYSAFTGSNAKPLNLNMTFKFTKASDGSDLDASGSTPKLVAGQPLKISIPTTKVAVKSITVVETSFAVPADRYTFSNTSGNELVITLDSKFTTNNSTVVAGGKKMTLKVVLGDGSVVNVTVTG